MPEEGAQEIDRLHRLGDEGGGREQLDVVELRREEEAAHVEHAEDVVRRLAIDRHEAMAAGAELGMISSFVRSSGSKKASTRGVMQSRAVLSPSLMISWIISLSVACSVPSSSLSSTSVPSSSSLRKFAPAIRAGVRRSAMNSAKRWR